MLGFFKSSFQKVKKALTKTRSAFGSRIRSLLGKPWDDATFEELEQILYEADLGPACAEDFVNHLKSSLRLKGTHDLQQIVPILKERALQILQHSPALPSTLPEQGPKVILIVGVNGSGKTTTIAKLAQNFQKQGQTVLLAAADTFRAAAIDQLALWAKRLSIEIVKSKPGSDPSGVAFDAITAAKSRKVDVVLIDTAGRLQNKTDLMQELEKMRRVCQKACSNAPHETYLVLDATTGQNALDQAEVFHKFTPLTGLILTKLDGSAKGGIVIAIYQKLRIPIKWIGVGEGAEDLMPFEPQEYINALFDEE